MINKLYFLLWTIKYNNSKFDMHYEFRIDFIDYLPISMHIIISC